MHQDSGRTWNAGFQQGSQSIAAVRDQLAALDMQALTVGHDLRQPLFGIALASENLRQMLALPDLPRERMEQALARIDEQVQRAHEIIAEAADCAAGKHSASGSGDLNLAVDHALAVLGPYIAMSEVRIERQLAAEAVPVCLGRVRAEQVLVNVICNAVESIQARRLQGWSGDGCVAITVDRRETEVVCSVSDNGVGLQPGVPAAAFRPFFTTKATEGTGLGLYICQTIVAAAGGAIALHAGATEGAVMEIRLPIASGVAKPDAEPGSDIIPR